MTFKEIVKLAKSLGFTTKAARAIAKEICSNKEEYAKLIKAILAIQKAGQKLDPASLPSFLF